jgi:hypothetical protein
LIQTASGKSSINIYCELSDPQSFTWGPLSRLEGGSISAQKMQLVWQTRLSGSIPTQSFVRDSAKTAAAGSSSISPGEKLLRITYISSKASAEKTHQAKCPELISGELKNFMICVLRHRFLPHFFATELPKSHTDFPVNFHLVARLRLKTRRRRSLC